MFATLMLILVMLRQIGFDRAMLSVFAKLRGRPLAEQARNNMGQTEANGGRSQFEFSSRTPSSKALLSTPLTILSRGDSIASH